MPASMLAAMPTITPTTTAIAMPLKWKLSALRQLGWPEKRMCSLGCRSIVRRPYRGWRRASCAGGAGPRVTVSIVSAVAKIEPLTTARALRGPFDYLRPDGVEIGALLEVPFAGRVLRGVVTGLADSSEHDLAAPRRVLEQSLPSDLVELALWMAAEFCSTPARALSLVAPPRVRARRRRCGPKRPTTRLATRASPVASASCWPLCPASPAPTRPRCAGSRPAVSCGSRRASCGARRFTTRSARAAWRRRR